MEAPQKCFLHLDMDAFFASVEQLDHPEWRRRPVIVGGMPDDRRSVVSTASYEARKFGVHSAMPAAQAYRLCPQGIYTRPRMARYAEISERVMEILGSYSPDVERLSIDEACVELTGTELLFGPPERAARRIKAEIKEGIGLTVSAGIAATRYLAKIASEMDKPDGFFQIPPGTEEAFMLSLPLEKIWGIGGRTLEKLHGAGFFTAHHIHEKSEELLRSLFGNAAGTFLYRAVRGLESGTRARNSHSLSAETTFPFDLTDSYAAETAIMELAYTVMFRMLREGSQSRTVALKLRYDDFSTLTAQETAESCIQSADELYARARRLFERKYDKKRGIRLLGIGVDNVETCSAEQETLFDFGEKRKRAVEGAIMRLEERHPEIKVRKARLIGGRRTDKHS
ncbi:MAG: DNA polymerase IV [Treponemataceae bacterium]|nr:DNA polymerase IV [Treponemataceae bacterium]